VVAVRTSSRVTAVRADLVADAATARRLRIRTGAVLAHASIGSRTAGVARLRLRVPAALRRRVSRASRVSGTLRIRTSSPDGAAAASRRVSVRR
jgi:hypothetical protein